MQFYPTAVRQYLTDPASGLRSASAAHSYHATLRQLHTMYPGHRVGDFTEEDLVQFAARPGLSGNSRAAYRTRLAGFFGWAQWKGIIPTNPAANLGRLVKGSNRPVKQAHWLDTRTVEQILADERPTSDVELRNLVIIRLGFTVGLRRIDIVRSDWSGVNLEDQSLSLIGKGGKRSTVYLPDKTAEVLGQWRTRATEGLGRRPSSEPVVCKFKVTSDFATGWHRTPLWGERLKPETIGDIVAAFSEKTGVKFAPHDMRRSYANMLVEAGMTVEEISEALRHENLGTTQRYLKKRQDAAYSAVKKIGLDV